MRILVTNDDGYQAKGLEALVSILRQLGDLTIVAPKTAQSGMSMAVTMGYKPIAVKKISESEHESWYYLDGTPASCVKFGIDNVLTDRKPDLVVSGINHGANAATAAIYSATLGAAMEGAVNGIPSIGVSLDDFSPEADFSAFAQFLPGIIQKITDFPSGKYGTFYNINFPNLPASGIKGLRLGHMGRAHWEKEYQPYTVETLDRLHAPRIQEYLDAVANGEPGEDFYVMAGDFTEDENTDDADHRLMAAGYIALNVHNIDNTDYSELKRLKDLL